MPDPSSAPVLSEARARGLRRLLWVALGLGVLLAAASGIAAGAGNGRYAVTLAVAAALVLAAAGLTLRALPARGRGARTGSIVTAVLLVVLAVPAVRIWLGLIMAVAGIGMLFVTLSAEQEEG